MDPRSSQRLKLAQAISDKDILPNPTINPRVLSEWLRVLRISGYHFFSLEEKKPPRPKKAGQQGGGALLGPTTTNSQGPNPNPAGRNEKPAPCQTPRRAPGPKETNFGGGGLKNGR